MTLVIDGKEYEFVSESAGSGDFTAKADGKTYTFSRDGLKLVSKVFRSVDVS